MAKENGINQIRAGALLSYIQMGLGVVIHLLYTPVMIRLLGQSEYGLYNTVSSTISMLSILSLGFNASYVRYFAKYKKNNDTKNIFKLNGLFLIIFAVIGIIALSCGIFISLHLHYVFAKGLTESEYEIARILMILLTINLAISFPMSVFSNIISANERFVFLKAIGAIKTVLGPLVTLPLLLMGFRSIAMVLVTVGVNLFVDTLYCYYVFAILKNRFYFTGFEKDIFKDLVVYTSFIAINIIIDQINWNIDKVLLGRFKGTTSVAVYAVGYSLYQCYDMFSTSISGIFTPRVHNIVNKYSNNDLQRDHLLTGLFVKVGRIQFLILGLLATGLIFCGKQFIYIWVGKGYEDAYAVSLFLIIPASIALSQNIGIEIQRAENKHQFRCIAYSVMAFINLLMSIYLCQILGAIGSAIGTAVSLIVANGFIMNIYYYKKCGVNTIEYWKNIISICKGFIIPILFGIIVNRCFDTTGILQLLIFVCTYSLIYCCSIWFLSMNNYERSIVLQPIKCILGRK